MGQILSEVGLLFLCILYESISKNEGSYALSFYRSKMILDRPNCFGQVQIDLVMSKSFWSGPNHFGQVQLDYSGLFFIIWNCPK